MTRARGRLRSPVAIVGYGLSPIERRSSKPLGVLAVETALAAIGDAGLDKEDIDGFTTGAVLPSAGGPHNPWGAVHWAFPPAWSMGFS